MCIVMTSIRVWCSNMIQVSDVKVVKIGTNRMWNANIVDAECVDVHRIECVVRKQEMRRKMTLAIVQRHARRHFTLFKK